MIVRGNAQQRQQHQQTLSQGGQLQDINLICSGEALVHLTHSLQLLCSVVGSGLGLKKRAAGHTLMVCAFLVR